MNLKIALEGLLLGSHDVSKCRFNLADHVKASCAIVIDDLKFETLGLFKRVTHDDVCLEVRIQVVVDRLGLRDEPPLVELGLELVNPALWVRLAEHVEVFELSARDVKLYLHGKLILSWIRDPTHHLNHLLL